MAVIDSTRSPVFTSGSAGLLGRVLGAVVAWNERRVTRKALSQLSDRELDDIGLSRGDIDLVARSI